MRDKMREIRISVVIPVYNDEKTIVRTLESINTQEYSNWECIIVENNSTDKSYKVIEKYVEDKPNFKLFSHKLKGAAPARNRGIDEASGEYVTFIDGDDIFMRKDLFSTINRTVTKIEPDLIYWNQMLLVGDKTKKFDWWLSQELKTKPYFKADNKTAAYLFNYTFAPVYPGRFCVRTEFLRENNIKYDTSVMVSEDALPRMKMLCLANKIVRLDEPFLLYTYSDTLDQVKEHGLVSSLASEKGAIAQNQVNGNCFEFIKSLKKDGKINEKVYVYACREICTNLLWGFEMTFSNPNIDVWQLYYNKMREFLNKNDLLTKAFPEKVKLWPYPDMKKFLNIVKDTKTANGCLVQWLEYYKKEKAVYEYFTKHPAIRLRNKYLGGLKRAVIAKLRKES
jgi:glycosyltransferase involved in cell wall biosynthesis